MFESVPRDLLRAIADAFDSLQAVPQTSAEIPREPLSDEAALSICWDPDSLAVSHVSATQSFLQTLAGVPPGEFYSMFASSEFPLPCSPVQFLAYFVDGALCLEEGATSWTRYRAQCGACDFMRY
jgi:hypothetical protein